MALDATRASIERDTALDDHALSRPGTFAICPTKPVAPARDLSRAHASGMSEAGREIAADPPRATGDPRKRTLVAVISH